MLKNLKPLKESSTMVILRSKFAPHLWFAVLSLLLTGYLYYRVNPLGHPAIDDAGIILKYLDNFRNGYFYTFNPTDGPVFGVSDFIHGMLTGTLAYLQVKPEVCLVVSNFLGSLLFFYFLALVFQFSYKNTFISVLCVLCIYTTTFYIPMTFFMGLETPLHLSFVMMVYLLFARRSKLFYPGCALVIISKLDALALVACLIGAHLAGTLFHILKSPVPKSEKKIQALSLLRSLALGFLLPMAMWTAATVIVFGSPFPQTFIAKNFYHLKSSGSFFPFLESILREPRRQIGNWVFVVTATIVFSLNVITRSSHLAVLFFLAGVATLGEYFYYNPAERMVWYYTLPETLFMMGFLLSPAYLAELPKLSKFFRGATIAVFFICLGFIWKNQQPLFDEAVTDITDYIEHIETERIAMGRAVRELTPVGESVVAGHGHPARESQRYVWDISGLSSKATTSGGVTFEDVLRKGAATVVGHGLISTYFQRQYHLVLKRSYYNVTEGGVAAFRIFARDRGSREIASYIPETGLMSSKIDHLGNKHVLRAKGKSISLSLLGFENLETLRFGVLQNTRSRTVIATAKDKDGQTVNLADCAVPAGKKPYCESRCLAECVYELPDHKKIESVFLRSGDGYELVAVEPVVTYLSAANTLP